MYKNKLSRSRRYLLPIISILIGASLIFIQFFMFNEFAKAISLEKTISIENHSPSNVINSQVITIGFAGPLSGAFADLGLPIANSVQLAISQTNSSGGVNINGVLHQVALVMADDECDQSKAPAAANSLISAGASAVVGHVCSGATLAAESIYNSAGVAIISPSATNPDVTLQGYTTTFRTVTNDGEAPAQMALLFRRLQNFTTSAIVETPDSIWGSLTGDYYQNKFVALGGTITSRRMVNNTSEITPTLLLIKDENPEVIFFNDPDPVFAGKFSYAAFSIGMTNTVIGWNTGGAEQFQLDQFLKFAEEGGNGVYASYANRPTRDMPGWSAFLSSYQAAGFSYSPNDPGPWGPYAYDATQIILDAIERGGSTDPKIIRDQIATTKNFKGVVGIYGSFSPQGDVVPSWTWLAQYKDTQWMEIHLTDVFIPFVIKIPGL